MKRINVMLSILLLSFSVVNISLASLKDKHSNTSQNTSTVTSEYEYIKQDGFIDLGYDVDDKNNNKFAVQRSSVNMVNFDMDTRSQSFETFDPNSYAKRSGISSLTRTVNTNA